MTNEDNTAASEAGESQILSGVTLRNDGISEPKCHNVRLQFEVNYDFPRQLLAVATTLTHSPEILII